MTRISCCVSLLRTYCDSHAISYRDNNPSHFKKEVQCIYGAERKWQQQTASLKFSNIYVWDKSMFLLFYFKTLCVWKNTITITYWFQIIYTYNLYETLICIYFVKTDVLYAFMIRLCGFNICISKCYFLFVATDKNVQYKHLQFTSQ